MYMMWLLGVAIIGLALVSFTVRRAGRHLPPLELPPGEELPPTRLQKTVAIALPAVAVAVTAGAAMVAHHGLQNAGMNHQVRLTVTAFMMVALAFYSWFGFRVNAVQAGKDGDERDRAILSAANAGQGPAMMVVLAAWTIGLAEAYRGAPGIPVEALHWMFWSALFAFVLAHLAGVLIGYRKQ